MYRFIPAINFGGPMGPIALRGIGFILARFKDWPSKPGCTCLPPDIPAMPD
uniref:Mediator of RNA polymerase II transcription subunit 15a isoform X2 n=1 Tax=Rhizophora mucronata TaxID=61149 RepID=A0A2P2IVS3_RHIMU